MTGPVTQHVPLSADDLLAGSRHDNRPAAGPPGGTNAIPDLRPADAEPFRQLSAHDRGEVAVVSLRGELDFLGACVLQAYLTDIRMRARLHSVADLGGLDFLDCACLSVLVRHCRQIRGQGGRFALAGPQPAVLRILAVTGLLTWFEVHDTVEKAVASVGAAAVFAIRQPGDNACA